MSGSSIVENGEGGTYRWMMVLILNGWYLGI